MVLHSLWHQPKNRNGTPEARREWSHASINRNVEPRLQVERLEDRTLPSFGFGWAFNVGGTSHEAGTGITTDTSGNLYVTGWSLSNSVNFDPNHTNPNNPN